MTKEIIYSRKLYNNNLYLNLLANEKSPKKQNVNIAIALDISGSMDSDASLKTDSGESDNLSRLNLATHAIKTVISLLDENDSVGIVTFATSANIIQNMTKMTDENKKKSFELIDKIESKDTTNIYDGLKLCLDLIKTIDESNNNVNSILLLTDGESNVDPPSGIIPTLKKYLNESKTIKPFNINTFGISYDINSELLKDLANIGNGVFYFIPDSSMIGTVFINYASYLLSTYVINSLIEIEYYNKTIEYINTGPILIQQPRELLIPIKSDIKEIRMIYNNEKINMIEDSSIDVLINSTNTRYEIIKIINSYINDNNINIKLGSDVIYSLYNKINTNLNDNKELTIKEKEIISNYYKDYENSEVNIGGQIKIVFNDIKFFNKWGKHYLRSLMNAYNLQQCINFKDPGVQHFAKELFNNIRDNAEGIFCKIPPPQPKIRYSNNRQQPTQQITSMASYYNQSGGCFNGSGLVSLYNSNDKIPVNLLKKGHIVKTFDNKPATIVCILKQKMNYNIQLCSINNVLLTPYHPVLINNTWSYPIQNTIATNINIDYIYNLVLDTGHIIYINDLPVITLGHNINDVVASHNYFGTEMILNDLKKMYGYENGLIILNNPKYIRDKNTNEVIKLIDTV